MQYTGIYSTIQRGDKILILNKLVVKKGIIMNKLFLILVCMTITPGAFAASVTLQPGVTDGIDTYVHSNHPAQPYGGNSNFYIVNSTSAGYMSRMLLTFGLPSNIINAAIQSATLTMYTYNCDTGSDASALIYLNRVTSSWDEMTVSWNTQPAFDTAYQKSISVNDGQTGWLSFSITDIVQFWASNPAQNYGVVLEAEQLPYNFQMFYSSENTSYPLLRPMLTIEYEPAAQPAVPELASLFLLSFAGIGLLFRKMRG